MSLCLSKCLDPADYDRLAPELEIVDAHFDRASPQHPSRRWEYAMALRALTEWEACRGISPRWGGDQIYDVGGAGSPFIHMFGHGSGGLRRGRILDPKYGSGYSLASFLHGAPDPILGDAIFCLSVLEHVKDLTQFCYHLGCLVAPGGLLVLTVDYCDDPGPVVESPGDGILRLPIPFSSPRFHPVDTYHFHWMRERIFSEATFYHKLRAEFTHQHAFELLGAEPDAAWHGPQVYDYSFASLALVKRR